MSDAIGQQVREMREAMRHTQLSLAMAIGVHPMTVSYWERDVKKPHPVFLAAIRRLHDDHQGAAA